MQRSTGAKRDRERKSDTKEKRESKIEGEQERDPLKREENGEK